MREISFFVNVERPETRVAEVQGGRLQNLEIERDSRLLGDIYLARVENIVPGMDAAFVDIGIERNALIYVGDLETGPAGKPPALPIEKLLNPGQTLVVQVARPPVGNKGARVTARISLPGRYTVLAANSDTSGVSRRIESADERERLRRIVEKARPLDHGIIVRSEAEGASADDIISDIEFGWQQLLALKALAQTAQAPSLLHRDMGLLGRLVRDRMGDSVDRLIIDAREEFEAVRALVQTLSPRFADRVLLHEGPEPLFARHHIDRDIARANKRAVPLPHGGSLVIDEAEALTAIDVNTGKFTGKHRLADTVLETNLEAVEEAARQLRVRNIGGVIVIDFIDMERTRDRIKVMDALELALKNDRTRTRIVQLSPLGLVEMTRRREGDSLRRLMHHACPYCDGDGLIKSAESVAIEARRRAREALAAAGDRGLAVQVTLHPNVAAAFLGANSEWIRELEGSTGAEVFLRADFGYHSEKIAVQCAPAASFAQTREDFALGQRFCLQGDMALQRDNSATYAVVQGNLILVQSAAAGSGDEPEEASAASMEKPAVVEIVAAGRWFHVGRTVVSMDPRDA